MPVPTLHHLCVKECRRNVKSLVDIGDLTYDIIKDVLEYISSPEQLHELEVNCPQLCGEDQELWQKFIIRDVPNWRMKNYKPKNEKKWYEIYRRYMKEHKEELDRDSESLRKAMDERQKTKEANTTKLVTNTRMLPKLPRDSRMIAKDGILNGGKRTGSGSSSNFISGAMRFSEGSRTKLTTGASVFLKAKREAKEIGRMNKLLTPMGKIGARSSGVQKAPQAMVDQHRREAIPGAHIHAPRKPVILGARKTGSGGVANQFGRITESELEKRERRLKAIKEGRSVDERPSGRPTIVESEDEEDVTDEKVDLFGDNDSDSAPRLAHNAPLKKLFHSNRNATTKIPTIRREPAPSSKAVPKSRSASKDTDPSRDPAASGRVSPAPQIAAGHRSPSPVSRTSSPAQVSRLGGLPGGGHGGIDGAGQHLSKRKKTVDIFNRGGAATKKPKLGR